MRTNPDYCRGLPGGLCRRAPPFFRRHRLTNPTGMGLGLAISGMTIDRHGRRAASPAQSISIGFFQWPTGFGPSALMSLPRVLHEHLDHDAELQRYHHRRDYEQLG